MFSIGSIAVGDGQPCYVIAEAGVNHNGELARALALVDIAADAGANAVKFQTFSADTLVAESAPQFPYTAGRDEGALSQFEMLRRLELPREWHEPLRLWCQERQIQFLSTPFHESDADWLRHFGVPAFKIPSGEVTNLPFVRHIAGMGLPVIASTGMATIDEVAAMVEAIRETGNTQYALLQCVSDYPARPSDVNLRAMATMREAFGCPVGFSDHTLGIEISLAAVALGAVVIEKHFTSDRTLPGPDHRASLEPDELVALVRGIRNVEASLGTGVKEPAESELETRACVRKSLVAALDLPGGVILTAEMIDIRRPGGGLPPDALSQVVGRTLASPLARGAVIAPEHLA